jgi:hypothetical protein
MPKHIIDTGDQTFLNNIVGNGTDNRLPNQVADKDDSVMTLVEEMLCGNAVRRHFGSTGSSISGGGSAGNYGLQGGVASVTNNNGAYAALFFGTGLVTHPGFSGANMRTDLNQEVFLHGVMLRFETNTNWVARIGVGQGTPNRVPALAGQPAASSRCWGVEFYYDGENFLGRIFWFDTELSYALPFVIPSLASNNWLQLVYSIRLRQTSDGLLEVYINAPIVNQGGGRLPATPISGVAVDWGSVTFAGRHFFIETANAADAASVNACTIHAAEIITYSPNF